MVQYFKYPKIECKINECSGIICLGIGKQFNELYDFLKQIDAEGKIKILADNDVNKHGEIYRLTDDKIMKIVSLEEANKICDSKMIIVISCNAYQEVAEQLKQYNNLYKLDTFFKKHMLFLYEQMQAMTKVIPENIKLTSEPLIPKVIHYCWFGKKPIPEKYKNWMKSWNKYCPDYEIKEWNENNYDVEKNQYMKQAYQAGKWGFVPDYARLDIIYNNGGIYLDTDVELIKNFDDLLYQKAFAGFESNRHVAFGLGFGSVKKLPLFKKLMDVYENVDFVKPDGSLNLVASPEYQTKVLLDYGLRQNGEYQMVNDLTIFPEKMLCGMNYNTGMINLTSFTHAIHHYDASWQDTIYHKSRVAFIEEMSIYNDKNE